MHGEIERHSGQAEIAELFEHHDGRQLVRAQTFMVLWNGSAEQSGITHQLPHAVRDDAFTFPLRVKRCEFLFEQRPALRPKDVMLLGKDRARNHRAFPCDSHTIANLAL